MNLNRKHYVYYCYEVAAPNKVVYVGRSFNPERRRKEAEQRYNLSLVMTLSAPMTSVKKACALERAEIVRLRPRLNKYVQSALSMLGKHHSKASKRKMSIAHTGHIVTPETRAKLSAAKLGVPQKKHTAEHNAKIGASLPGQKRKPYSEEHKAKISAAHLTYHADKRQFLFEEMMGSIFNHNATAVAQQRV